MSTIHIWIPNVFEFKGGIQVYSKFFLEALHEFPQVTSGEVCLKHDREVPSDAIDRFPRFHFHCAGTWPLSLRTLGFSTQLLNLAVKKKPSLIITTHLNFTSLAYYLKRFFGIPYWTVAHGVDAWDIDKPSLKQSLQAADLILSVSNYTRDRLIHEQNLNPNRVNLNPNRVKLLPNTFNEDKFYPKPKSPHLLSRYQLSSKQPIILTVARLDQTERYKGYDVILRALPKIIQVIPNVHYLLVGKGSDRLRIEQLIRDLNLSSSVTLTGFVPDIELCDHYNLCDVFAMPSKGEGFGIVYLESLACGKPTLGGNQDGAIDALCQGQLGALVDPDNIDQLAHTLIQIIQGSYPNPLMYQPQALRQRVIEIYGFQAFQQKLMTILQTSGLELVVG